MESNYFCLDVSNEIIRQAKIEFEKLYDKIKKEKKKFENDNLPSGILDSKVYYLIKEDYDRYFETYQVKGYTILSKCPDEYTVRIWSELNPLFEKLNLYPLTD